MARHVSYHDILARTPASVDARVVPDGSSDLQGDEHELLSVRAESLNRTVQLSAELMNALRALQTGALTEQPTLDVLRDRIAHLVDQVERAGTTRERVLAALPSWTDGDNLQLLATLLGAWMQRPNDLLVMMKVAENSSQLASAIQALQDIRRIVLET